MQLISTTLDSTQLGEPAQFGNLTLYPLLADSPGTPAYLTLDEAIERKLARVTATVRPEEARQGAVSKDEQLSEQGSVPELFFENLADRDILLADGEELVGARQNRILNISILVAAKKRIVVPVSCVESGRWSYRSRDFASSGRNLYAKARAEKMRHVSASMRHSGERRSDQAALWQSIACKEEALGVSSATHSMGDIYEQRAAQPFVLRRRGQGAVSKDERAVSAFIQQLKHTPTTTFPGVDQGSDLRLESLGLTGGALIKDGVLLHLAAFRVPAAKASEPDRDIPSFLRRASSTRH